MQVRLNNVRLAFPVLFEPKPFAGEPNSEPSYSASLLLDPAKNADAVAAVRAAMTQVAKEKWTDPAMLSSRIANIKAKDRMCLHDGNLKAQYAGFPNMLYVSARNAQSVLVVDRDKKPLTARSGRPYAGCFVNALVDVYAQDNSFGFGINASLMGIQFVADGEAFGAGAPLDPDAFDDISDTGAGGADDGFADLMGGGPASKGAVDEDIAF